MSEHLTQEEERRTTFLELFFDLVLVFAVTQLAAMLHDVPHHAPGHEMVGVAEVALLAALTWWLWSQFAWLGTSVRLAAAVPRALTLVLTGIVLIAAVGLPVAFQPGVAVFGVAYGLVKLGALVLYRIDTADDRAHAAAVDAYLGRAAIAPLLVMGASFVSPGLRLVLWSVALAIEVGGTLQVGRQAFRVSPLHFAERHALVLIVVLGEAVVALGGKAVASTLSVAAIGGLLGGFALVAALWWSYFAWSAEAGEGWLRGHGRSFAQGDVGAAARMARDAFTFGHFPLVAGMIAVAVALKDLAAEPLSPWSGAARVSIGAGLSLYLGGHAAVVWRGAGQRLVERLLIIPVVVATAAFAPLPAGLTSALLAAQLLVALSFESRRWRQARASAIAQEPAGDRSTGASD